MCVLKYDYVFDSRCRYRIRSRKRAVVPRFRSPPRLCTRQYGG